MPAVDQFNSVCNLRAPKHRAQWAALNAVFFGNLNISAAHEERNIVVHVIMERPVIVRAHEVMQVDIEPFITREKIPTP